MKAALASLGFAVVALCGCGQHDDRVGKDTVAVYLGRFEVLKTVSGQVLYDRTTKEVLLVRIEKSERSGDRIVFFCSDGKLGELHLATSVFTFHPGKAPPDRE